MQDELMNTQDIAKYLKVHEMTVYRWFKNGTIPGVKFNGRWRVLKSKIVAIFNA
jgi:excisionase family DNA binding protein